MQRYFSQENYHPASEYQLTGEIFHHMIRVMRMKEKDQVYLVFADQITIIAEISAIAEDSLKVKEIAKEQQAKELPLFVTIASGYPKGDKLEWIVQKGTELGGASFIGFPAQASVVKWDSKKLAKKSQRLEKIAQEAAEQSQRQVTPKITLLTQITELYELIPEYDYVLVAYEESAKQGETAQLAQVLQKAPVGSKILAIFGPEGGIMPPEVQRLTELGGILCGLGPRILRTETAPLYLLSCVSFQQELMKQ